MLIILFTRRSIQFLWFDIFFLLHALDMNRCVLVFIFISLVCVYLMDIMMENDTFIMGWILTRMSFLHWITCADNNIIKTDDTCAVRDFIQIYIIQRYASNFFARWWHEFGINYRLNWVVETIFVFENKIHSKNRSNNCTQMCSKRH